MTLLLRWPTLNGYYGDHHVVVVVVATPEARESGNLLEQFCRNLKIVFSVRNPQRLAFFLQRSRGTSFQRTRF